MNITRPEGTEDLIGQQAENWIEFSNLAFSTFSSFGYNPIFVPIMERKDLYVRGIGSSTDVVSKEMYNVISGGNIVKIKNGEELPSRSELALRPEGTAGVVRAIAQNKLRTAGSQPVKLSYAGNMFRAERPQKGRLRQFNQIGIECLGSTDPYLDAQSIYMMIDFINKLGIDKTKITLKLNSIGCENCRPKYREVLLNYIEQHKKDMCDTCNARALTNPLRAFDCKNEDCSNIMLQAPLIQDFLCEDCKAHFQEVCNYLEVMNIEYSVDNTLVRGLDYYTQTVFELSYSGLGAQNALGGGGRYNKLMHEISGEDMPGLGFAIGYERCRIALAEAKTIKEKCKKIDAFFIPLIKKSRVNLLSQMHRCQVAGIKCDMDFRESDNSYGEIRSLKSQLKLANKLNSTLAIIVGEDEVSNNQALIKNLETHKEELVQLDLIFEYICNFCCSE